jgi:L-asparagine transporter-like permease
LANPYSVVSKGIQALTSKQNPTKTLRWSAPASLLVVTVLYILVNVAYFSAASREDILNSKQIAAAIFFQQVFGTNGASRALNVLICISAFGNLIAVMINTSRMLRETGRSGTPCRNTISTILKLIDIVSTAGKAFFLGRNFGHPRNLLGRP